MTLSQGLQVLFPPSVMPASENNKTKLAELKRHLVEGGEYLISHILEGRAHSCTSLQCDFDEEWAYFERRHQEQKSPEERLLETANGLALLYYFSNISSDKKITRLDNTASSLVDEFVRRSAACTPNPIPQRSLSKLLESAVHVKLPSWSAKRAVKLWRELQLLPEIMFPHAIAWARSKSGVEAESMARNAIVDFCVAHLQQVLQESTDQDSSHYSEWSSKLRLLSRAYNDLAAGELIF